MLLERWCLLVVMDVPFNVFISGGFELEFNSIFWVELFKCVLEF